MGKEECGNGSERNISYLPEETENAADIIVNNCIRESEKLLNPLKESKRDNPHTGHRARMRERFFERGSFDSFSDVEILEFLLYYGYSRKDTHAIAKALLDEFGSLKGVLEAEPKQLIRVRNVGPTQAALISMVLALTKVWNKAVSADVKQITNRDALENYCKSLLSGRRTEAFYVICVDAKCRLRGSKCISEGSLSEVSAYPRKVMEAALNYNAHSVFFCHNHPGGTCAPSTEDISSTLQLQRMLSNIGITVLDHIIVADNHTYSMAQHGDIDFRIRSGR